MPPIDPSIPLQARAPDIGGNLLQLVHLKNVQEERKRRNKLVDIQTERAEIGLRSERNDARIKSLAVGALSFKPFLDANDLEGARAAALRRKSMLEETGFPSNDTDEFLQMLESDPQAAMQSVNQAIQLGEQMGFLKAVEQPEKFEPVTDDQGNIVGQRNTVTGQVVKDPRSAPKPANIPSNVNEFEYWKSLPKKQQDEYLRVKRATQFLDVGSGFVTPDPTDPTKTSPVAERELKPAERPEHAAAVTKAEKEAAAKVEHATAFPKARNTLTSLNQQWDLVEDTIDTALEQTSPFTAGVGAWTKVIPASPAKNLEQSLESIKANIGFDKLQDMRANSPTGGALGQVSDFENKLLQSVKGSLQQNQSVSQLVANLKRVKSDLQQLRKAKQEAFQTDFKEMIQEERTMEFDRGVDEFLGKTKRIRVDAQGNVIGD
jgi:hypothetical protein